MINWDGVTQTVRSYYSARQIAQSMKVELVQESTGFFTTMTLRNIVIDWDGVHKRTQSELSVQLSKWRNVSFRDFDAMHRDLIVMRQEARRLQSANSRYLKSIVETNTAETKKTIDGLDNTIKSLEWVRDISTTTLVIGSGFISGGASVAVLGTGSALSGVGKYQDSGSIGSAVVTATGTFVLGSLDLRGVKGGIAAMSKPSQRAFFWLVKMPLNALFDVSADILEGKTLAKSSVSFGLKTGANYAVEAATDALLERLPMPVLKTIRYLPFTQRIPMRGAIAALTDKGISASSEKLLSITDTKSPKSLVFSAHLAPNKPVDDDAGYVNTFAAFHI